MADGNVHVITGMEFDKDDVVTVAVAKIEASIRSEIRKSKEDVKNIDKELEEQKEEYQEEAKKAQPMTLTKKIPILKKAFKAAALKLDVELLSDGQMHKDGMNVHRLQLHTMDEHGRPENAFHAFEMLTAQTKRQKKILESRKLMKEHRTQRIKDGVDWKRRLQDMPAAERQMKAVVVESELKKSKDGRALVDLLTKQYTTTMKLIEM